MSSKRYRAIDDNKRSPAYVFSSDQIGEADKGDNLRIFIRAAPSGW